MSDDGEPHYRFVYGLECEYEKHKTYAYDKKVVEAGFEKINISFNLLDRVYIRLMKLSGHDYFDWEGVWDLQDKQLTFVLILHRRKVPTDEKAKAMKEAISSVKKDLGIEVKGKWYTVDISEMIPEELPEDSIAPLSFT